MNSDKPNLRYKITLVGEQAVGKTSITRQYTEQVFTTNTLGTTGLELHRKSVVINNNNIQVIIYDSAGHERFRKIAESHYKGSNGLIVVYDITDSKSFELVCEWIEKLKSDNSDLEILLIGNKIDLTDRVITKETGLELSKKYNIEFMETSAKTGENVEESFLKIIEKIHKKEFKEVINKEKDDVLLKNEEYQKTNNKIVIDNNKKIKKNCCAS